MTDNDVLKVLVKADSSIILCYNLTKKMITHAYYNEQNLCAKGDITIKEFSEFMNKINLIIDEARLKKIMKDILLEKDTFSFPDVYKDNYNHPIKVYFKGGRIDEENIIVNIYKEKFVDGNDYDELTKCVSFNSFKTSIEKMIEEKTSFISGILDIDNFKVFNEKYNHILGDVALIECASVLREICGTNGLVCRQGGDEFLFYYKMDSDYDKVHEFVSDLKDKVENSINDILNVKDKLTLTIGLSRFPLDGDNFKLLLIKNKSALIRGKKKARNCFIIYLEEKCGYVDEKTIFDKKIENSDVGSANISVLTGVLEFLNGESTLKKRVEDSISLIGTYFYLDRIVVTVVDPKKKEISDIISWNNPSSPKKEYKYSSKNIELWKEIYEESNLLVVNSEEEGRKLVVADVLKASNIISCVAIELKQEGKLFGQIRFEMTTVSRNWISSDISSFALIAKMMSIKFNKEYIMNLHYKEMYYDRTTDVFNLQKFLAEGETFIADNNHPIYSILDFEIYDFTNILNAYGTAFAAKVLITIATYLKTLEATRENVIFGRTYDNRFSLIYPSNDIDDMNATFDELKAYVSKNIKLEKGNVILQASIYINDEGISLNEALDRTVIARRFGTNFTKPVVFNMSMYEKEIVRLELESHIEKALNDNEFVLYLQPKIFTSTKKIAGAEALTRWNYNFEKIIYPNDFIPLLEKNGYITRLDYNVFENVCKLQRNLIAKGLPVVPISVNVSRSINDFDLYLENLERIRQKHNVPADLIEIEITEGMYTNNDEVMIDFINKLHQKGYKVSMDDFGSGNSNLTALSKLNFDTIKFDKSFLTSTDNEKEVLIIYVMTKLVKNLNMKVLFEGVETEEYDKYLTEIGIDYIQGYYYDKPLPIDEFLDKYIKKKLIN